MIIVIIGVFVIVLLLFDSVGSDWFPAIQVAKATMLTELILLFTKVMLTPVAVACVISVWLELLIKGEDIGTERIPAEVLFCT